jgi:hypothetical protein
LALPRNGRQRGVELVAVAGEVEVSADALCGLRIDRIEAPIFVKIADIEGGDLCAAESDLQADRENGPIAQAGERVVRRRVENSPRLRFRERRRASLVTAEAGNGPYHI